MKDGDIVRESSTSSVKKFQSPHLKDYLRILMMRRWILFSVFIVFMAAAAAYITIKTPIYNATALLLIESSNMNLTEFKSVYDPTTSDGDVSRQTFLQTQYELILCRPLLERTYKKYKSELGNPYKGLKEPLKAFKACFSVKPVRRTRLAEVSFKWKNPETAARVVDNHVKEYLSDYRERRLGVSKEGLLALKEREKVLKRDVTEKAQALQNFIRENGMVSLDKDQDYVVEGMKDISRSLRNMELTRIEAESRFSDIALALSESRPLEEMPEIINSNTIRDLKLEYIKAKQAFNELGDRFGPNHPEVKSADAKVSSVTEKIKNEITNVLASAEADFNRASKQESELKLALSDQEKLVMSYKDKSIEYNILNEEFEALNKTYITVSERIQEIDTSIAAGEEDNIFIIARPRVPTKPVAPRKSATLVIAAILSIILGATLCFFIEYLDTTVKTKEEVEKLLGIPVIGYVPSIGMEQAANNGRPIELVSLDKPNSTVAEAFRTIRTALTFSDAGQGVRNLVLTSSVPMEGKTLISANLAISLAKSNKKVLLVDADLRRPRLTRVLSPKSKQGLSSLLINAKGVTFESVVQTTDVETFQILPSGPIPPNPAELLGSPRMKQLVDELSEKYDHIIFDTPPAISATDSTVLSQYVNGTILVVRAFTTQRELAVRAKDTIQKSSGKLVGAILNSVDVPRGSGYGGYSSYYYYDRYYSGDKKKQSRKMQARSRKDELIRLQSEKTSLVESNQETDRDSIRDSAIDAVIEAAIETKRTQNDIGPVKEIVKTVDGKPSQDKDHGILPEDPGSLL